MYISHIFHVADNNGCLPHLVVQEYIIKIRKKNQRFVRHEECPLFFFFVFSGHIIVYHVWSSRNLETLSPPI
jgi:hypothetical protein